VGIPNEVTLKILSHNVREHGRIIWRNAKRIGVAFDQRALRKG
jgi:hypothetical protein